MSKKTAKPIPKEAKRSEREPHLPLVVLTKSVFFPENILPLTNLVGLSAEQAKDAQQGRLTFGVIASLPQPKNDPKGKEILASYGTQAVVTALIKLPNGELGTLIKGTRRFKLNKAFKKDGCYWGDVTFIDDKDKSTASEPAQIRALKALVHKLVKLHPQLAQEAPSQLFSSEDETTLSFLSTALLPLSLKQKTRILGMAHTAERTKYLMELIAKEIELLEISGRIQAQVKSGIHDNLRRSFLRDQMQAIKKELGNLSNGEGDEVEVLKSSLDKKLLSPAAKKIVQKEFERLAGMHPSSPEYQIALSYLGVVNDLPWDESPSETAEEKTEAPVEAEASINIDLKEASSILAQQHYGLEKVKERIIEFLAVVQHKGKVSGQILLLAGPPGVGKTSLGESIARVLKRPFARISLGGVKDEAEIRGHRRTYIGAMPGKIIEAIKHTGSRRPVLLLDEIDKLGNDGLRDISGSLLELLDPEQNSSFVDHYLGFPFDLSEVLFIATANSLRAISAPLLDRLELLEISGYSALEKQHIAKDFSIPRIRQQLSLSEGELDLAPETIPLIIQHYTREAGVRQLNRCLGTIGRKRVKELVEGSLQNGVISAEKIVNYLGMPKYLDEPLDKNLQPGVAIGLAYTSVGGDIFYIESRRSRNTDGKRGLLLTGSLGKVMQESAQAVFSYLLTNAELLGIDPAEIENSNIHVHLPDGATPKDGPSAGLALLCAMASLFTGEALSSSLTMTGEITLRGQVLPIGGLKEKLLAAQRYGKREVIIPKANWLDLDAVPDEVLRELTIYPVSDMKDVLRLTQPKSMRGQRALPVAKIYQRGAHESIFHAL